MNSPSGYLSLIMGPMYSSKTTQLLLELTTLADTGMKCLFLNSNLDDRKTQGDSLVSTHSSHYYRFSPLIKAVKCKRLAETKVDSFDVIGIDESQFFPDLYETVKEWVNKEKKIVFCAGLDGDRNMMPFGQILSLIPLADKVEKRTARCKLCLEAGGHFMSVPAPFTYARIPKAIQVVVGGTDTYQAVCRSHYLSLKGEESK